MEPIQQSCQFKDMPVIEKRSAKTTYPTGNKNFAVLQAFPSGFNEKETDPFLMCDEFGPTVSEGIEQVFQYSFLSLLLFNI